MKNFLDFIGSIAMFIGFACMIFCTSVSIIYCIYYWAVYDVAFKIALWGAAKIWLSMFFGGVIMIIVGKCFEQ